MISDIHIRFVDPFPFSYRVKNNNKYTGQRYVWQHHVSSQYTTYYTLFKKLRIFWQDQITNKELWKGTKQPRIDLQIRKRKWWWVGHTLRKLSDDIARQALEWNPQGKRGRGRPTNTRWRTVLEEAKGVKKTWVGIKTDAKNRVRRRILVEALCSTAEWQDLSISQSNTYHSEWCIDKNCTETSNMYALCLINVDHISCGLGDN